MITGYTVPMARQYLWLLGIPLLAAGLWTEWQDFFRLWYESIVYNHGYLVLAGIFFLLYTRRGALASLRVNGSGFALFLLAGACSLLIFAQAADVRFLRLALVPFIVVFWGWAIWGWGFVKVAGGPVLLLLFAVPFWDDLSPMLQHITVFFNDIFLRIADIEATINEFYIVLEVGTFLVEDGCSGVRYLMVALFLGSFYGQLYYQSATRTVLLVVIAGLLSMLANWIRVFGIIAAGHYTNMETSLVEDHELFGWVIFFVFTLVPLYFISGKLEPVARDKAAGLTRVPQPNARSAPIWPVLASLLILWPAIMPLALESRTARVAQSWNPTLPDNVDEWRGPLRHANIWKPDYQGPDVNIGGVYVSDDLQQVQLQITGYRRQAQNKELIFYGNELYDSKLWKQVSTTIRDVPESEGISPGQVNETIIRHRSENTTVIIWSWYDIGDVLTHSGIEAKITGALKKMTGDGRGALWALASYCSPNGEADCNQQRSTFAQFLAAARD